MIICQVTLTQQTNGQGKSTSPWTKGTAMHPGLSQLQVSQKRHNTDHSRRTLQNTVLFVCYIMQFLCPVSYVWLTSSCCIRPDLYSVNGSHDPSALTSESDFLWHTSSGRLLWRAYWWGLVVPKEKRVIHWCFTHNIKMWRSLNNAHLTKNSLFI